MKEPLNTDKHEWNRPKPASMFLFRLVMGLGVLCVAAGLMIPVYKSMGGKHHRVFAGQFQADARTFVSGVRFLLRPELPDEKPSIIASSTNLILAKRTAMPAPARVVEMPEISYNQTSSPAGPLTNLPVQI